MSESCEVVDVIRKILDCPHTDKYHVADGLNMFGVKLKYYKCDDCDSVVTEGHED